MPLTPLDGGVPINLDKPRRLIWNYRALRATVENSGGDVSKLNNPFYKISESRLVAMLFGALLTEDEKLAGSVRGYEALTIDDVYRMVVEDDDPLRFLTGLTEAWNIAHPKRQVELRDPSPPEPTEKEQATADPSETSSG